MKQIFQIVLGLTVLAAAIGCGSTQPVIPAGQSLQNPNGYKSPAGVAKQPVATEMPPIARNAMKTAERLNNQAGQGPSGR